jgi:hypothetical protein
MNGGRVTLPKKVREKLSVKDGEFLTYLLTCVTCSIRNGISQCYSQSIMLFSIILGLSLIAKSSSIFCIL